MASFDSYFSVLALFILFRETIEASIICGVLLQFLNRSKPALKKAVWWGVAGGVGVSIIFGVIFIAIFYTAKNSLFSGAKRDWFKGIISWIAGLLITILGFAMLRFLGWEAKWKRKLAAAMAEKVPEVAAPIVEGETDPAVQPVADAVQPAAGDDTEADAGKAPAAAVALASAADADGAPRSRRSSSDSPLDRQPAAAAAGSPAHQPTSLLTSPTLTTASSSSGSAGGTKKDDPKKASIDVEGAGAAVPDLAKKSSSSSSAVDVVKPALELEPSADDAADAAVAANPIDLTPATRKENLNIFFLVFTTVVREGIESVVFLGGLGNVKLSAVPLPAFVGIVCGCLVGMFLYYSGKQVKHIKWLVIIMAIIIFFIAAGQISIGTDALMRAGAFGYCSVWLDERPWYMVPIYDWSSWGADTDPKGTEPADEQHRRRFFALVRAIFGFQDKGTPTEIIAYCCYWGLVLIVMAWKAWRGTLLDADYKHTRAVKKAAKEAAKRAAEEEEARAREAAAVAALEAGEGEAVRAEAVAVAVAAPETEGAGAVRKFGWRGMCGSGWRGPCFAARVDAK